MPDEKFVPRIDSIPQHAVQAGISASVLRLDLIHPVVSGNKWFKLKEYLKDAAEKGKTTIITFGGAYSNHIVATAAACKDAGFKAKGIIRGEQPANLSHTLRQAMDLGMQLYFISRQDYKKKEIPTELAEDNDAYLINEGGYGQLGAIGAREILANTDHSFTHILAAVGTGTTLSGLAEAASPHQSVIGVSALKNNFELEDQINALLSPEKKNKFSILHDYHFGGYAKHSPALIQFMNGWYQQTAIPLDFVYTAKLFYAFSDLCKKEFFPKNANLLLIHSGGLQGNHSLKKGTLIF